jgi:hypothetical protein
VSFYCPFTDFTPPPYTTVEHLLQRIATMEPRYHALIDTGALITGYSNEEVAKQLLDRGLLWCEGVVYLDDDDKQQVGVGVVELHKRSLFIMIPYPNLVFLS